MDTKWLFLSFLHRICNIFNIYSPNEIDISVTQLLLIRLLVYIMNGILVNLSLLIYKQSFTNKISINNTTYNSKHTYI